MNPLDITNEWFNAFVFGVAITGAFFGAGFIMFAKSAMKKWAMEFGGWKEAVAGASKSLEPVADVGKRLARVESDVHAIRALLNDVPKAITASNQAIEVAVQHGEEMNEVRERLGRMEGDLKLIRDELIAAALARKENE